jgi:hypothetical protein
LPPAAPAPAPAAAATTDLAAAAGASGSEAEEAGAEATPPAMDEARARPENQEVEAGGEVIAAATRLAARASGGWRLRAAWWAVESLEGGGDETTTRGVEIDWN